MGDYLHRLQGPVVAVLVPEYRQAVVGRLGDVMGGEEGDVWAEEGLDPVDQTRVGA